jgi:hypothetical protein
MLSSRDFIFRELVAVFPQRELNLSLERLVNESIATAQATFTLRANPNVSVTGSAGTVLHFARAGEAETLLNPFVGLHFIGHRTPSTHAKFRTRDSIDRRPVTEGDKSEFRQGIAKKRLAGEFSLRNRKNATIAATNPHHPIPPKPSAGGGDRSLAFSGTIASNGHLGKLTA